MQPRDQLTAKEIQVATLVWEGLTNREIAVLIGANSLIQAVLAGFFTILHLSSRLRSAILVAIKASITQT